VPSGGGAVAAAPAAGGGAPAAAEAKEEKKEEEKVCVFMFSTPPHCLTLTSYPYRKSPMRIWALVCSIRIKLIVVMSSPPPPVPRYVSVSI
jgi:hypothetical protein